MKYGIATQCRYAARDFSTDMKSTVQIKILFSPIMDFIIHLSSTKDLENHTSTAKDIKHRLIIAT